MFKDLFFKTGPALKFLFELGIEPKDETLLMVMAEI